MPILIKDANGDTQEVPTLEDIDFGGAVLEALNNRNVATEETLAGILQKMTAPEFAAGSATSISDGAFVTANGARQLVLIVTGATPATLQGAPIPPGVPITLTPPFGSKLAAMNGDATGTAVSLFWLS